MIFYINLLENQKLEAMVCIGDLKNHAYKLQPWFEVTAIMY